MSKSELLPRLVMAVLLITIIPYFVLSLIASPAADDFHFWHEASTLNSWDFQVKYYLTWSGRYFQSLVIGFFPLLTDPFDGYKFIPLFLFVTLFLALFTFLKSLARNIAISNFSFFLAALVIFNIYINNLPTLAQGFYWLSGAATYTLGNILLLFLLSLLLWSDKILISKNLPIEVLYLTFCLLLVAAIVGSSEPLSIQLVLAAIFGVLITTYTEHPSASLWRIILVATLIFSAISFLAPGNFVRQSEIDMATRRSLFFYLLSAVAESGKYLNLWASNLAVLSASVLVFPTALSLAKQFEFLNKIEKKSLIAIAYLTSFLSITFASFFLQAFLKRPFAERVINISYLTFLLGWFIGIFIFANLVGSRIFKKNYKFPKYVLIGAQVVLIIGLLFQVNFIQSMNDLLRISRYQAQVKERHELINSSILKNNLNVKLPAFTYPPETIFNSDITKDPNYYMNQWYAKFLGLESVTEIERH